MVMDFWWWSSLLSVPLSFLLNPCKMAIQNLKNITLRMFLQLQRSYYGNKPKRSSGESNSWKLTQTAYIPYELSGTLPFGYKTIGCPKGREGLSKTEHWLRRWWNIRICWPSYWLEFFFKSFKSPILLFVFNRTMWSQNSQLGISKQIGWLRKATKRRGDEESDEESEGGATCGAQKRTRLC